MTGYTDEQLEKLELLLLEELDDCEISTNLAGQLTVKIGPESRFPQEFTLPDKRNQNRLAAQFPGLWAAIVQKCPWSVV